MQSFEHTATASQPQNDPEAFAFANCFDEAPHVSGRPRFEDGVGQAPKQRALLMEELLRLKIDYRGSRGKNSRCKTTWTVKGHLESVKCSRLRECTTG